MKNVRAAILALSAAAFGAMAAEAQYTLCYITNTSVSTTNGNMCYGYNALGNSNLTVGGGNSAFGTLSLYSNGDSYDNTATGYEALYYNTTGDYNTAAGANALFDNTTGEGNTTTGYQALYSNSTGGYNVAAGLYALQDNTTGSGNTAAGTYALQKNTTADDNSAFGNGALYNTTGGYNTAIGTNSLISNTTGEYNISLGYEAGYNLSTGSYNIDIGNQGSSSDSSTIRIGSSNQTSFYAAGVDGVGVSGGVAVYINSSGQLGTVNSSIRFKEDVHDMGDASGAIYRLRPVTFRYKQPYTDGSKPIDYGLIAEEVAKVYPDLVVKGTDGKIQTVQYQKLTPMLLNEVQKQHRLLEQMQTTLKLQQQTMAQQQEAIQLLKTQQAETVQALEKRLAALERSQASARLEARLATQ